MRNVILVIVLTVLDVTWESTLTFPKTSSGDLNIAGAFRKSGPKTLTFNVANIGLKIVRELLQENENVIVSPLNVYSCLSIIRLGAAGITEEEILEVLGPDSVNTNFSTFAQTDGVSYSSAVFLDRDVIPKADFVDTAVTKHQTSILNFDFSDGEGAKNVINRWISDRTNETINNFLHGVLDSRTKMIVVSALLFNGKWLQAFSPAATTIGKFYESEDSTVDVQLMNLMANVSVVRNPLLDAIGLPYYNREVTLYLILPKAHGLSGVKKLFSHLNVNSMKKLKTESIYEEVLITLPKMTINGRYSLARTIKQLGIMSIFNPSTANFTNIVENNAERLFVSDIYHSVHFNINEEGTTASAATAGLFTKNSKYVFQATRPFIILLVNEEGMILFMGAVARPVSLL